MTYGSTFTGIGGFDLGFDQAGLEGVWQVECDKDCNRVLQRQCPDIQRPHADIANFEIYGGWQRPDVICGGFPCQDLSVAGRRAGLAGERSGLWHEFHRVIAEFKPRVCVVENVPGLFSSNGGKDFYTVIRGLAELGYCVGWTVLDSQYFGVAQRRERVFIVGSLGNGSCAQILFESESVRGDSAPGREERERVAETLGGSSQGGGLRTTDLDGTGAFIPAVARRINAERDGYNDGSDQTYISSARMTAFGEYVDDGSASTLKERDYKDATDLVAFTCKDSGQDCARDKSPTLRAMPHEKTWSNGGGQVAIAVRTAQTGANGIGVQEERAHTLDNTTQAVATPMSVRRLTPRECERLQGFPDDWTRWDAEGKEISDSARYRMLGNAVSVPVAKWLGQRIMQYADAT